MTYWIRLSRKKFFQISSFFLVLSFTFILRAHNFDRVPAMGHLEEQMFAWAGLHLIERGIPRAWSSLDFPPRAYVYKGPVSYQGGEPIVHVNLVEPWLEHPPVFSLVVGFFAHLYGANRDGVIPTSYIRTPMILIAALVSLLVFLIAKQISGFWTGLFSMLIYGTTPILVVGSRMAVPENLITLFYMIMIFLLIKFQLKPKFKYLVLIPIMAGMAGLSKATGFFTIFLGVLVALEKHWFKSAGFLLIATIPFVILFFIYGLHFDPEIFWKINAIQALRPVGFANLGWFFVSPAYDIVELVDTWFIFLLLSSAYFLFSVQTSLKKFLGLAFILWLGIVMFSSGQTDLLPWYRFPSYPLLSILGAWGFLELVKRADIFAAFLISGLLLGARHLLSNPFRPDTTPFIFRLIISSLLAPSLLYTVINREVLLKISRILIVGVIVIGFYFNSKYIYNQFEITCESTSCPFGPSTALSSIHFPFIWRWFVLGEPARH